ncbi:hypothetical protein FB446DRAFT_651401 [Lentinula raphanica]|nr:hypothetical protein FB446DRAFT_651401 [Lentinula raphanica]
MSFDSFNEPWALPTSSEPGDIVTEALKKEKVLKEIAASQEDLKALYGRVQSLQKEVDKVSSENQTLQMYIDNLAVQIAKNR